MPLRYKQRLITHLKHDSYQPADIETLIRDLRIGDDEREAFTEAVNALAADGLFDPAAVRALWEAHLSGRASHQTVLWNILMMQTWRSGRQVTRACA